MLGDIGIKTTVQLMDSPTYADQLKSGKAQLILRQYEWDNNDILEWFLHSKNLPYPNYLALNDKKFDSMLDQANFKTPTSEERDKLYVDLHKYLIQTWYPWAPIRQGVSVFVARSNVKNFAALSAAGRVLDPGLDRHRRGAVTPIASFVCNFPRPPQRPGKLRSCRGANA